MHIYLIGVLIAIIPTIHFFIFLRKSYDISLLDVILNVLILLCSWGSVVAYAIYLFSSLIIKAEDIVIYKKKD